MQGAGELLAEFLISDRLWADKVVYTATFLAIDKKTQCFDHVPPVNIGLPLLSTAKAGTESQCESGPHLGECSLFSVSVQYHTKAGDDGSTRQIIDAGFPVSAKLGGEAIASRTVFVQ